MSDSSEDTAAGTWQGIVSSLVFAGAIAAILLAIFAWGSGKYRDFYYPKHYQQRLSYTPEGVRHRTLVPVAVPSDPAVSGERFRNAEPSTWFHRLMRPFTLMYSRRPAFTEPPNGLNSWSNAGVDGHMMILYARLMTMFCIAMVLPGIAVAVVNTLGGDFTDPLYRFSTSRLENGSGLLWVHVGCLYIQSMLLLGALAYGFQDYRYRRANWMMNSTIGQRSVLLTGLPGPKFNAPLLTIAENGLIVYHSPAAPALDKAVKKNATATADIEDLASQLRYDHIKPSGIAAKPAGIVAMLKYYLLCGCCIYHRANKRAKVVQNGGAGNTNNIAEDVSTCHVPSHAIDRLQPLPPARFYETKIHAHERLTSARSGDLQKLEQMRASVQTADRKAGDRCFVTFKQPREAQQLLARAQNGLLYKRNLARDPALQPVLASYSAPTQTVHAYSAPEPQDIIWKNYDLSRSGRRMRRCCSRLLLLVLIIIAFSPAVFAAALTNLQALGTVIGFLEPVLAWGGLSQGLVQSLLPALLVTVFLALLARFVRMIGRLSGAISRTAVELFVLRNYFFLQVVSAMLSITIATTIFGSIDAIINDPSSVLPLLGVALPQASGFFVSFVILQAVSTWPGELADVIGLILYHIKRNGAWTQRKLDVIVDDLRGGVPYGAWGPNSSLLLTIICTYAFLNPIIIIPAIFYFAFSAGVFRHQVLYRHTNENDTGGLVWPEMARQAMNGLLLSQAIWIAYMFIRQVNAAGFALIPMFVGTILARLIFSMKVAREATYAADLPPLVPESSAAPGPAGEYKELESPTGVMASNRELSARTIAAKPPSTFVRASLLPENDPVLTWYEPGYEPANLLTRPEV